MVFQKNHKKLGFLLIETLVALLLLTLSVSILVSAYGHIQCKKRDGQIRLKALELARRIMNNKMKGVDEQENDFQTRIEWRNLPAGEHDMPEASLATVHVRWHNGMVEEGISLTTITVPHG